jgi:hypothetical protein
MLFLNSWRVSSHIVRYDTSGLQLFKNSNDTREKLGLNLHSLSVSELLEYGRIESYEPEDIAPNLEHIYQL